MAKSYPTRDFASGVWRVNDIADNLGKYGTWPSGATRGVFFAGGASPEGGNVTIDYITIETTGDAADFGDSTRSGDGREAIGGLSSFTRGCAGGGNPGLTTIDYVTILTTGNSADFGDMTRGAASPFGGANATRGLFAGGYPTTNVIDYITTASTGNAVDFGDLPGPGYEVNQGT